MNFAFESVSLKSKPHNEDFYFDLAMPRGHFFAVLDFDSHDYSNLNPALRSKLETIVGSFSSLPDFSDDLFLGFLAKEITNFVYNLTEQSGDPKLMFSAALCLISGNRFSYFQAGDIEIRALSEPPALTSGPAATQPQLGKDKLETPLTDRVQNLTLSNTDVVLIMTRSVSESMQLTPAELSGTSEPKSVCELLMGASEAARDDRTVVAICGPYQAEVNSPAVDVTALSELKASLASLESRLDELSQTKNSETVQLEQKLGQQIQTLKEDLGRRPATIDLLEFEDKLKSFEASLASKAETTDVLGLQRDVLKLGLTSTASGADDATKAAAEPTSGSGDQSQHVAAARSFPLTAALIITALALLAGFGGGWIQSRLARKSVEAWSVKTSGNQIVISRLDAGNAADVTMAVAQPVQSTGEQRFSSFADVKRYVDTVTVAAQAQSNKPAISDTPQPVSEVTIKPGDSLKKLAQSYNVPPEKIMELNPAITKWDSIQIGQKIVVPGVAPTAAPTPSPTPGDTAAANQPPVNTTEITVGPGDSINELARRFNTTAAKLRELNPTFNWPRIQAGQKVIVPAPSGD